MRRVVSAMLLLVAVIHLLPVSGVVGADRLATLYGVTVDDPNLVILMRHRAVLFGLLGVWLAVAAFVPSLQLGALIAGSVSVGSFLIIAAVVGEYNAQVARVVVADIIAAVCLAVGAGAYGFARRAAPPGVPAEVQVSAEPSPRQR